MTEAPLALSQLPQFTAEHWQNVHRHVAQAVIERVTRKGEYSEIVLQGGTAFMRKSNEIQQLLTANLQVNVEVIGTPGNQLVTGLFVPGIGWAFRMTNDDLAAYAKQVAGAEVRRRQDLKGRMIDCVTDAMVYGLRELGLLTGADVDDITERNAARFLATVAIGALEEGPGDHV